MGEIKAGGSDVLAAGAALGVVVIGAAIILLALLFLFTVGSPLLLLGAVLGLGVIGIIALVGIALALLSLWYVIYAYIKSRAEPEEKPEPGPKNYTMDRIKKT
ncbi:MAG: hypothetical protein AB1324_04050 [Candidatus Micrarchaeota archaeon]